MKSAYNEDGYAQGCASLVGLEGIRWGINVRFLPKFLKGDFPKKNGEQNGAVLTGSAVFRLNSA